MDSRQRKISVLMLPWLAYGHISPFLELAKKLTERNFFIYFCATPVSLSSINLSPRYSLSIKLIELHLSPLPELPPHYHTTKGLPLHLMTTLKQAYDMASPVFSEILEKLKPDLLIYDFVQPWAPAVALSHNIPAVHFLVSSAVMTAFILHYSKNNPGDDHEFPSSAIFLHDYMKPKLDHFLETIANGIKDGDRYFQCFERSSKIFLMKTFRELEGKYIDYLSVVLKKKMVPVGPLVRDHIGEDDQETEIIKWLDKKAPSSTVFVSFGSEYFLAKEEMEEIAHGLELSGLNFIWVVRFPGGGEKLDLKQELPEGFLERITRERGLVVEGWAPQARILAHESIGGFVSHCGWGSVMESMRYGVAIIALPMHLEQPFNARLVEEVGVGIEVIRNKNGIPEKEEIARVIKEVVVEIDGEKVRRKAREMSEYVAKKGDKEMDEVVDELKKLLHGTRIDVHSSLN